MNNKNLLKISLITSIIGILILLILTSTISPKTVKIKDINDNSLNNKVQIAGKIAAIRTYKESNFQIITINDSTGKIDVTIDNPINITKNQSAIIIGKVTEYKNTLQIQAEKIMKN